MNSENLSLTITEKEFEDFKRLLKGLTGISLSDQKKALVIARLSNRLFKLGITNFTDYLKLLSSTNERDEIDYFINKMTTHETYFFREEGHFQFLQNEFLPLFFEKNKNKSLRIWSCASSSGEEPYTLAMICHLFQQNHPEFKFQILASDVSSEVLSIAKIGLYAAESLRNTPPEFKAKYFSKKNSDQWKITPALLTFIQFKKINLLDNMFPLKESIDLIFCRNVMIYFENETREAILGKLEKHLDPNGLLFLGHSEGMIGHPFLNSVGQGIYKKRIS